jgi:ubiquinone/menaquinone biosynthesis C-methylase UbiE
MRLAAWLRSTWLRLVDWGFFLLYNDLAWLYDPVSWLASLGHWHAWQRTMLAYLPGRGQVLEVGAGPGHMLVALSQAGLSVTGLDLSPAMLSLARSRLRRDRVRVDLCRGEATGLPFGPSSFDAVIAAFPTAYAHDQRWPAQVWQVLRPGGRLVIVERATFETRGVMARAIDWVYHATGQNRPRPDLGDILALAGFLVERPVVPVDDTAVHLVVAQKTREPSPRVLADPPRAGHFA